VHRVEVLVHRLHQTLTESEDFLLYPN
jgi:hypothetical protein